MGARDRKAPADCQINLKGESKKLGDSVPRGFLTACRMPGETVVEDKAKSGRLELAPCLARPARRDGLARGDAAHLNGGRLALRRVTVIFPC